jgi:DNA-binding CsgD family transcriptional regulator
MKTASARIEAALRMTAEWQAAATVEELAHAACDALLRLIPADASGWNEIDLRNGTVRVLSSPRDYFPEHDETLAALVHENPLTEIGRTRGAPATISDLIGVRDYRRRQIYSDIYRPYGVEDQLGTTVRIDHQAIVGIVLNRGARTFTKADRTLLELLRGHLAAGYRRILEREETRARQAAAERALELQGQGLVVLDRRGFVVSASPLHARWFRAGEAPEPGTYVRDDAELVVRRVDGEPALLLLDERRLAPEPERVRELGLSRREAQVVSLAARGLTNAQIAAELVLSKRTIHKHFENVFTKLGVHSRHEAGRILFG